MAPRNDSFPKASSPQKSPDSPALSLAFFWHMHQPYYKDPRTGQYKMPWVRLHGLKDYYDMAAVLDRFPSIRQTFNLVPSLIEQIQDYAHNEAYDEHLLLTEKPAKDLTDDEKEKVLSGFFNCSFRTMIYPYPRFREFLRKRGEDLQNLRSKIRNFDVQDFLDLQVWSNLAWTDPIFREDPFIRRLFKKGRDFTEEEKKRLLHKQREILAKILPKYRELQDRGQIEITFSPYFHPIMPLICDSDCAKFALPHVQLPKERFPHPEDAKVQINEGLKLYERTFGRRAEGLWPSEGSVSEQIVPLVAKSGVKWIATDEEILFLSLAMGRAERARPARRHPAALYRPYRITVEGEELSILFRDHTLSDLIGFVYSKWDAEEAADDFIRRLHKIRKSIPPEELPDCVVSVILDGENCWEYYKNDGHDFLSALYTKLSEDRLLRTTTISDFLRSSGEPERLTHLFPGSWINHNFRVWIGHPEDNLAWDFLKKARNALVQFEKKAEKTASTEEILKKAWKEIYVAEGSDWNWWYGDEHEGPGTDEFDRLYRSHLLYVYELIGTEAPEELYQPIKMQAVSSHFLPPTGYLTPTIDGKRSNYYEWQQAGHFDTRKAGGTMHQVSSLVSDIYFGSDEKNAYFGVETAISGEEFDRNGYGLTFELLQPPRYKISIKNGKASLFRRLNESEWKLIFSELEFAFEKMLELAIPISLLEFEETKEIWFRLIGERQGKEMGKWPAVDVIKFDLPSQKAESIFWEV
ncbi:MAG: glycoside hydrolase family 57 protein [Candidatus Zixiibacteriota bacterium]